MWHAACDSVGGNIYIRVSHTLRATHTMLNAPCALYMSLCSVPDLPFIQRLALYTVLVTPLPCPTEAACCATAECGSQGHAVQHNLYACDSVCRTPMRRSLLQHVGVVPHGMRHDCQCIRRRCIWQTRSSVTQPRRGRPPSVAVRAPACMRARSPGDSIWRPEGLLGHSVLAFPGGRFAPACARAHGPAPASPHPPWRPCAPGSTPTAISAADAPFVGHRCCREALDTSLHQPGRLAAGIVLCHRGGHANAAEALGLIVAWIWLGNCIELIS